MTLGSNTCWQQISCYQCSGRLRWYQELPNPEITLTSKLKPHDNYQRGWQPLPDFGQGRDPFLEAACSSGHHALAEQVANEAL